MKSVLFITGLAVSASTTLIPKNIEQFFKYSSKGTPGNLIKNGNFEKNQLGHQDWYVSQELLDWEIPRKVEVGKGTVYNPNWGNSIVVELDGYHNDVIRQKLNLKYRKYTLEIDYAARSDQVETSQMSVSWNAKQVAYVKGQDIHIHTLRIQVQGDQGCNILEITGEGKSDGYGMTVTNVRLS